MTMPKGWIDQKYKELPIYGDRYHFKNDDDKAKKFYQDAIELDPSKNEAWYKKGRYYSIIVSRARL
jgi:hypothetical protein